VTQTVADHANPAPTAEDNRRHPDDRTAAVVNSAAISATTLTPR
jgi:hypothetical protein